MPLKGNLLEPISEDRPCGKDIRYEPIYDQIKEARRQDDELSQGEWKREFKKADWNTVLKLGQKVLAEQSKDLQIVAWVTEALLNKEGVTGLTEGLELTRQLLETYWDKLYPRFEEDYFEPEDLATPVEWLASQLLEVIRLTPVSAGGRTWVEYNESRRIPDENEAYNSEAKGKVRAQALKEGKLTPEEFETEFASTTKAFYAELFEDFEQALKAVADLDSLCQEKFEDAAPGFGPLRNVLTEVQGSVRVLLVRKREIEPDPEPEPEPEPEEEEIEEAPAEEAAAEEVAAVEEEAKPVKVKKAAGALTPEPTDEADAFRRVQVAAKYLRGQNPSSPVPFLLLRALRWGELRQAGNGYVDVRLFEPPQTEVRQQLKTASLDGNWQAVLDVAEAAAGDPCGRGWLDLQRYAITALQQLGYSYPADALISLLRGVMEDFPDLASHTMMDDTPTANAETQRWLLELFPPPPPPPEPEPPPPPEPEPEPVPAFKASPAPRDEDEVPPGEPDLYEQATEMAARGNVSGAISLLSGAIATERSGRGRFLRRVQLAQICIGASRPQMARNILEEVVREVETRKLEEWESAETLAHPLALLYQTMGSGEEEMPRKRDLYAKICRLDPGQALSLASPD